MIIFEYQNSTLLTIELGSLALTVSKFRESFIISLVLFFLMVIKLQYMHKSISLIQQSSSMSGDSIIGTWILW